VADNRTSHWPISLSNGAATLFNLFLPLLLVRIMPPDQVGRYKIFFLYVMLGPSLFVVAGLTNGLYHWAGSYPKTKNEVRESWTWFLAVTLLLSTLGLCFSSRIAPMIRVPTLDVRLFFLYCPFGLAAAFMEDLMIARGDIWMGSYYGAGFQVFRSVAVIATAWWGRRMDYLLWAFLICSVVRALAGWLLLHKSKDLSLVFSKDASKKVLQYALPVSLAALGGLALSNVDQLMLSFRLHAAEFAFYTTGCLTVPPLLVLEISVNRVLIPRLSQAFANRRFAEAKVLYAEGVNELFRILLPATVGLMIYSRPIIRVLFTHRYMEAAPYLRFYALFYLSMAIPFDAVARAIGDGMWIMQVAAVFAPLSIAATWIAINHWGAMGALTVFLALQFSMRFYSLIYQKHRFAAPITQFLPLREMSQQTGLAFLAGSLSVILHPLFADERVWFLVTGLAFTLIYFGGVYVLHLRRRAVDPLPIRVLELVQYLSVGGLERMVFSLSQALNQQDHFSAFVASYDRLDNNESSLAPQFENAGIPFIQWHKKTGFSPRIVSRLLKIIFSGEKQILHAHDLGPLIYGSLTKGLSLGRVQLVFTLHTLLHVQKNRRYRLYFKYFLRFADRIIAVSPSVKAGLVELGIDPGRIHVVPNGATFTSPLMDRPSDMMALKKKIQPHLPEPLYSSRWMLYLARLHSAKGQDVALEIWSALPKGIRADWGLFFVGPKSEPEFVSTLQQKINGLEDSERVRIVGPSDQPQEWMQTAHLFISGSRHEGMPLAPLEAAGSGLPLLLSDIPGHAFLKPWAHLFDPHQPREGAEALVEILDAMKETGEAAFFLNRWEAAKPLRMRWSETAMAASYMDVFQSIWKTPAPGTAKDACAVLSQ
jgi:O-antigen/teichoic acid export membrane protein/glycosyltransferase involved in cell wall biosynthesis